MVSTLVEIGILFMNNRIAFIDIAKAIAIVAVISGHTAIRFLNTGSGAWFVFAFTFTFHLPVFFLTSGYFLHIDKPFDYIKEIKNLIIPYVISSVLIAAAACISNFYIQDMGSSKQLLKDWLSAGVYGTGDIPSSDTAIWPLKVRIGGIWFLLALFWARLIVCRSYNSGHPFLIVIISFIFGLLSSRYIFLPFDIQSGMCAAPFVFLGTYARQRLWLTEESKLPLLLPFMLLVWIWAIVGFNGFSMAMCLYGNTIIDLIRNIAGALFGSLSVIFLLQLIERNRFYIPVFWHFLSRIGSLTLYILIVHIAEDDIVRWNLIVGNVSSQGMSFAWLGILLLRVIIDTILAVLLRGLISKIKIYAKKSV